MTASDDILILILIGIGPLRECKSTVTQKGPAEKKTRQKRKKKLHLKWKKKVYSIVMLRKATKVHMYL